MKFIKTEGKTDQEVQDFLDQCASEGANPNECVEYTNCKHEYPDSEINVYTYAGVDLEGDTLLSDHLDEFTGFDIFNLLAIKEAAEKVVNAHGDIDEHWNAVEALEVLF